MENEILKKVYTIGYSGFTSLDDFIATLKHFRVNVVIDVRSHPYSLHYENYDKDNLERALNNAGIFYRNYAREFGARQDNPNYYTNGILDFNKFTSSSQFAEGVAKIDKTVSAGYVPVLMCAEKEPTMCHRAIMISKKLADELWTIEVEHILPNGKIKTRRDIEKELLDIYFPDRDQYTFFFDDERDEQQLIEEAYKKQNLKIGFHKETINK